MPLFTVIRLHDEHSPCAVWCHLNAPRAADLADHAVCLLFLGGLATSDFISCISPFSASIASAGRDHPCVDFNFIIISTPSGLPP